MIPSHPVTKKKGIWVGAEEKEPRPLSDRDIEDITWPRGIRILSLRAESISHE